MTLRVSRSSLLMLLPTSKRLSVRVFPLRAANGRIPTKIQPCHGAMLGRVRVPNVWGNARTRHGLLLLLVFELTAVLLWLPAILWPFTFTWDENTFNLVALRLLEGELPYTTTFENKSPLTLLPQSGALLLVGQSPSGMRLSAALILGVAAFLVILIAPGARRLIPALLTGLLMLLLWVTRTNGLAWMSELNIAVLFLATLLLVLKLKGDSIWQLALVGVAVGTIPLVRINWSFVALILFIAFVVRVWSWRNFFLIGFSSLIPLLLVLLAYSLNGQVDRLWAGAIGLPRSLGDGEGWRLPSLADDQLPLYWLASISLITVLMLIVIRVQHLRNLSVPAVDWIILSVAWALTVGAWIQPYDFPYQTLQIVPLIALAVGRVFACASGFQSVVAIPAVASCLGFALLLQTQVYSQFDWRNQANQEAELTAAVAQIPDLAQKTLWAPDNSNLLYWRLNKLPVTPLASMPYLVWDEGGQKAFRGVALSEGDASQYVFDLEPDLIIARNDYRGSYNGTEDALSVWRHNLEERYRPLSEVREFTIWERRP